MHTPDTSDSPQWAKDFWKRLAERDTDADFDASGKRVIRGESDAEHFEAQR